MGYREKVEGFLKLFGDYEVTDLSHTLENGIPTYPTHAKYFINPWPSMGDPAEMNGIMLGDHTGTHVDSPSHFVSDPRHPQRRHIDEIGVTTLIGRAVKLTFGPYDPDNALLTQWEIAAWERQNGVEIQEDDIVIFNFQWGGKRWAKGAEGFAFLDGWPGLAKDAVDYLVEKRVRVVGTDCISLDSGDGGRGELPSHYGLLPKGILIMENLTNLDALPSLFVFMALPLKLKHATGSPIRAIALVPRL